MARGAQGAPAAPVPSPRARRAGRRAPLPSPPQPASTLSGPPGAGRRRMGKRFCRSSRAPLAGSGPTRPDTRHPPPGGLGATAIGNLRPCDRAHGGRGGSAAAGTRPAQGPKRNNVPARGGGLGRTPRPRVPKPSGVPDRSPGSNRAPPRRREAGRLRAPGPLHLRPPGQGGPTRTHLRGQPGPRVRELRRRREAAASPAAGGGCTGTRPRGARRPGP